MLLKQTLLYLPAQTVGPAFQFMAVIVWTYWLTPEAYGIVALLLAAQDLVFLLCLSWWSHFAIRYGVAFQGTDRAASYQTTENWVLLASCVVQLAAVIVVLVVLGTPITPVFVLVTFAFIASRSVLSHLGERARGLGHIGAYTLVQTLAPILGFGLGLGAIAQGWPPVDSVLAGFAVVQVGLILFLFGQLDLAAPPRRDPEILRSAGLYGVPLLASGGAGWLSAQAIRLVVNHFQGAAAVGLVSAGWGIGQRVISVAAMLTTAASFPLAVRRLVGGSREAARAQVSVNGALLFAILLPATAGMIAVAAPAIELLVGPAFREVTAAILPIAVLSGAVRNFRMHFADQIFMLMERPGDLLKVNLVEAAATLLLCTAGLLYGGVVGACLGCLAAHTIGTVLCFVLAWWRFGLKLPLGHMARAALATGVMLLVLQVLPWRDGPVGLAVEIVVSVVVYALALAILYARDLGRLRLA